MDEQLKQRLVGAVVLVGAAVIFVPAILHSPADGPGSVSPPTPAEGPSFSSRVIPLEEPRPVAVPERPPASTPLPRAPAPPEPVVVPAPPPPASADPPPAAPASLPADAPAPAVSWLVQLGSFSNTHNANALTAKLQAKGYAAFTRPAQSAGGPITRVYVGPAPTREAAGAVVERLQRETKLRGIVVRAGG